METLGAWTDDLPLCNRSGVGLSSNEVYRKDGKRAEMHVMYNRHFHFSQSQVQLYGLFDGFGGHEVADFAMKRMPAEFLLGQLDKQTTTRENEVRGVLRSAFAALDQECLESVIELPMSRIVANTNPTNATESEEQMDALATLGASVAIALIVDEKLYVANAGDTGVVLCRQMEQRVVMPSGEERSEQVLRADRLYVNHLLDNEDEELRLAQLGVDTSQADAALKPRGYTRCLGFHGGKRGYKDNRALSSAVSEPVVCEPEVHGAIPLDLKDPNLLFLLLFTRPLLDCLAQVASAEMDLTHELCRLVYEQFSENSTLNGVAQSVIDKVVRMHRDHFEQCNQGKVTMTTNREDMSLIVRAFNANLAPPRRRRHNLNDIPSPLTRLPDDSGHHMNSDNNTLTTMTSVTTESSSAMVMSSLDPSRVLPLNENGRIQPYVSFDYFHQQWQLYQQSKLPG